MAAVALFALSVLAGLASAQDPVTAPAAAAPPPGYIFIDCGAAEVPAADAAGTYSVNNAAGTPVTYTITPATNTTARAIPATSTARLTAAERTLRVFPVAGGCYATTVAPGNWSVRLGFAYFNYDGLNRYPQIAVQLKGVVVDQLALDMWENPQDGMPTGMAPSGTMFSTHYTEYEMEARDGKVELCLGSLDGETLPILNSLELVPYTPNVMPEVGLFLPNASVVLSLKHRITFGGPSFGPAPADDPLLRRWHTAGPEVLAASDAGLPRYTPVTTRAPVTVVPFVKGNSPPPVSQRVFQTGVQGGRMKPGLDMIAVRLNYIPVDSSNLLMARLFFSELNETVGYGDRMFNISFGSPDPLDPSVIPNFPWMPNVLSFYFDIFGAVENQTNTGFYMTQAGCFQYPMPIPGINTLFMFLTSEGGQSKLPPLISGLELYEVVSTDSSFQPCVPMTEDFPEDDGADLAPTPSGADVSETSTQHSTMNRPAAETGPLQPGTSAPVTGFSAYPAQNNKLSTGAIVGIVIGVLVGVAALTALIVVLVRRRRPEAKATAFHRFEGEHSAANPL